MTPPILLIDNRDSFTFNLVESFRRLGSEVKVVRNADVAMSLAEELNATIVLSPGPGSPSEAGCCLELIEMAIGRRPVIGICLGHQAIVEEAGGTICRAPLPVHGKSSLLPHDGRGPFRGLATPISVGRYHSLCTRDIPSRLTVHAQIDGMAMAISDREARQAGLQFHPESILTAHGDRILANMIAATTPNGLD